VSDGIDPLESKRTRQADAAKSITFVEAAARYIEAHRGGWSPRHGPQWEASLRDHAMPVLGTMSVRQIGVEDVLRCLELQWKEKTPTLSRVRGRIEKILDWAQTRGFRPASAPNPADWNILKHSLASEKKLREPEHHPALDYREMPGFMSELQKFEGVIPRATEFLILCAARAGEVLGARWPEIDMAAKVWTIPARRMKSGKPHTVPLSPRCLEILREIQPDQIESDGPVFRGTAHDGMLGHRVMRRLVNEQMSRKHISIHGMRASFRTWCSEQTNYPYEICEAALAHTVGSAVERSYARSDLLERRRRLMDDWAKFCGTPSRGKVVPIRRA
jgi:integrase